MIPDSTKNSGGSNKGRISPRAFNEQ